MNLCRQSNFEFLRILCMLGILTVHILIALYQDQIHSTDFSFVNQFRVFLLNCCAVGVNVFVMISGFFSIILTKRKLIKFIGQCWWYTLLGVLMFGGSWLAVLFPVTETDQWFLVSYLGLMLVTPLLNAGLSGLSGEQLKWAIACMFIGDVYLGYMHQCPELSVDGYNLYHFICIYSIGHLIRREDLNLEYAGWWCIGCFSLMTALHAVKMVWFPISVVYSLHYNSPILIIASVLVFLWSKGLKISQSKLINCVGASVFSVYLLHCLPAYMPHFGRLVYATRYAFESPLMTCLALAGLIVAFFMVCVLVDKVRIWVFDCIERRLLNKECPK